MPEVTPSALPTVRPNILPHNWIEHVTLESTFQNDISLSHVTGVEQRILLGERPTRALTVHWTAKDRRIAAMILGNLLRAGSQAQPTPVVCDITYVTAAYTPGDADLFCATSYRRFFTGQRVVVCTEDGTGLITNVRYATIASMTSSKLTLNSPYLSLSYAVGAMVFPLMEAELELSGSMSLHNDAIAECNYTALEVYGPACLPVTSAVTELPTYSPPGLAIPSAIPVLTIEPSWVENPTIAIERPGQRLPVGRAQEIETYLPRPIFNFDLPFIAVDRATAWNLIKLWHSRGGSNLPFFLPNPQVLWTFQQTNGSTEIWIDQVGNVADIADFIQYIVIRHSNGTRYPMPLVSATSATGKFILTVGALPAISDTDIVSVTSGHVVRFKTDSLREEWLNDEICTMKFDCAELVEEIAVEVTDIEDLS